VLYMGHAGACEWWGGLARPSTPDEAYFGGNKVSQTLCEFAAAQILFWELPVMLLSKRKEPVMLLHHIFTFAMAIIGMDGEGTPRCGYYGVFLYGVIEISSVPLNLVTVFKPGNLHELIEISPFCATLNSIARVSFALLFLWLRCLLFPRMILLQILPDCYHLLSTRPELPAFVRRRIYFSGFAALLLTAMQLYWGSTIVKQMAKQLMGSRKARQQHSKKA